MAPKAPKKPMAPAVSTSTPTPPDFGPRLATLRKAAGYTQHEFADHLGITRRMYSYYESENHYPPPQVLALIAHALSSSTDYLLGLTPAASASREAFKPDAAPASGRFQRRLDKFLHLPRRDQDAVLRFIDTLAGHKGRTAAAR